MMGNLINYQKLLQPVLDYSQWPVSWDDFNPVLIHPGNGFTTSALHHAAFQAQILEFTQQTNSQLKIS